MPTTDRFRNATDLCVQQQDFVGYNIIFGAPLNNLALYYTKKKVAGGRDGSWAVGCTNRFWGSDGHGDFEQHCVLLLHAKVGS